MRPRFYYNDRFRLGTLSGSATTALNPVRRIADGSITLPYTVTSGVTPSGVVQVTLASADAPPYFVVARANLLSGYTFVLEKEDVGGGNNETVLNETLTSGTNVILAISGSTTKRAVWRLTATAASGATALKVFEMGLMDRELMPRSNEVGVARTDARQFRRTDIPGGEPFVVGAGPSRRRTNYNFTVISGSEVNGVRDFILGVGRGEHFMHTDDLGRSYWCEMAATDVPMGDEAGVYRWSVTVQEVATD